MRGLKTYMAGAEGIIASAFYVLVGVNMRLKGGLKDLTSWFARISSL